MLQKLLTYGSFLVREGADFAAAWILLGCVDTLAREGPDQDTLDAISGRTSALQWVFDGLAFLENTDSVFGALRALQVQFSLGKNPLPEPASSPLKTQVTESAACEYPRPGTGTTDCCLRSWKDHWNNGKRAT